MVAVRQPNAVSSGVSAGFMFSNNQTSGASKNIAQLMFLNEAIGAAEKRVAQILVTTGGTTNSGKMYFRVFDGGSATNALIINRFGTVTVGDGLTFPDGETQTTAFMGATGGGSDNSATGTDATVGGGAHNTASANNATVGGGYSNLVTDDYGTIGGGYNNQAGDDAGTTSDTPYATVGGGDINTASGYRSTVGGGYYNEATVSYATIPGGYDNTASGDYSFAAGRLATASHAGSFVWADSSGGGSSANTDTFNIHASNGVYLNGALHAASDRNSKENIEAVESRAVLAKVAALPMSTWNYKTEDGGIRHMGPMGQDFHAAFGLGRDEKHITTVDADGVALAAIQGLYGVVQEKDATIAVQNERIATQQERIEVLESKLEAVETLVSSLMEN
jgi:hypothetical protein